MLTQFLCSRCRLQSGLTSSVLHAHYKHDMMLDTLWVVGLDKGPSQVTVNGQQAQFQYRADIKVFNTMVTDLINIKLAVNSD